MGDLIRGFLGGFVGIAVGLILFTNSKHEYAYADEARLVGYCNGKYLIRAEEDEFPESGCVFIEPITWKEDLS